jgi:hypothetical protein
VHVYIRTYIYIYIYKYIKELRRTRTLWAHILTTIHDFKLGHTIGFEDADNLVASNTANLGNAVGITQKDSDLRRCHTLASKLADLLTDLLCGGFHPGRGATAIRKRRTRNTLAEKIKKLS